MNAHTGFMRLKGRLRATIRDRVKKASHVLQNSLGEVAESIKERLSESGYNPHSTRVGERTGELLRSITVTSSKKDFIIYAKGNRPRGITNRSLYGILDTGTKVSKPEGWPIEGNLRIQERYMADGIWNPKDARPSHLFPGESEMRLKKVQHPGVKAHNITEEAFSPTLRETILQRIQSIT